MQKGRKGKMDVLEVFTWWIQSNMDLDQKLWVYNGIYNQEHDEFVVFDNLHPISVEKRRSQNMPLWGIHGYPIFPRSLEMTHHHFE